MAEEELPKHQTPVDDLVSPTSGEDVDTLDPALAIPHGDEVIAVTEALLFSATQPMNVARLSFLMNGVPEQEVTEALSILRERYSLATSGLMLMEVGGGYQLATRAEVADWVLRLHKHRKKNPLTPALIETLSIIAYKQPLTRAEVEMIRGVDCGTALRSLQDAGLVEIVGRKEVAGRPPLYGTTELFLKTFGLKDINALPSIGEFKPPAKADGAGP